MKARQGGKSGKGTARRDVDAMDAEERLSPIDTSTRDPHLPRCRVVGCNAVLQGGQCPACTFRASKYKKLFELQNPNCECSAPKPPPKTVGGRQKKFCTLCTKLRVKMKVRGFA